MRIFDFLKFFRQKNTQAPVPEKDEYLPHFWEDDYCQIEIVPFENYEFVLAQAKQIAELANKSRSGSGFTETFGRGTMPVTTLSKEIRVDYFENTLSSFEFKRARHIWYDKRDMINCESGKTKAFGFSNFTIFFDTEGEFVENIWLGTSLIVSVKQYDQIESALYSLGEDCELILVDWNSLEVFDLRYQTQIDKYLMDYWK